MRLSLALDFDVPERGQTAQIQHGRVCCWFSGDLKRVTVTKQIPRDDFSLRASGFLSYTRAVRALGIDCGGEYTGYAVVEELCNGKMVAVSYGAIRLRTRDPLEQRLLTVWNELRAQIEAHRPDMAAIEDVFYGPNAKSMLKLGEVRGAAMAAVASCGLTVAAYAPLAVKSAVVGYGKAEKSQVQHMVTRLLGLPEIPHPPDAADALAIAICHLNTSATLKRQAASR